MQNTDLTQDQDEMIQQEQHDHPTIPENIQNRTEDDAQSNFSGTGEGSTLPEKNNKREHQDNAGSMFKNDRKTKDSHPDITGSAMVNGVEFYVSGWRKNGAKGDFYSLSFKAKSPAAASDLI